MKFKLTLNISERLYAIALLNQFKGSLEVLVDAIEDTKNFRMTDEDWKKADRQVTNEKDGSGQPVTSWTWDDEKGGDKDIEVTESVRDYLVAKMKEANDKGEFTFKDRAAITLSEKLKKEAK